MLHSNSTEYGGNRRINKMRFKAREIPGQDNYTLTLPIDGNSAVVLRRKTKQL
jgi:hypothetical protein